MNAKTIAVLAVCAAVIAAAVSGVVVWQKRERVALAEATKAESLEVAAKEERRKAEADARAAEAKKAQAEASAKAAADSRKAEEARLKANRLEEDTAAANLEIAENNRKKAVAEANAAADAKEAEKVKAKAARDEAEAAKAIADEAMRTAELNAQAEADKLAREKLRSDAVIAEAKLLELRRIDFETIERSLVEYKQELDERERALRPDKTAADLAWVAEAEAETIGETNRVKKAVKVLPENDPSLPKETRELARRERLLGEAFEAERERIRNEAIARLETLLRKAREEDRVVDAESYFKTIKSLYPDWKPGMQEQEKEEEKK